MEEDNNIPDFPVDIDKLIEAYENVVKGYKERRNQTSDLDMGRENDNMLSAIEGALNNFKWIKRTYSL